MDIVTVFTQRKLLKLYVEFKGDVHSFSEEKLLDALHLVEDVFTLVHPGRDISRNAFIRQLSLSMQSIYVDLMQENPELDILLSRRYELENAISWMRVLAKKNIRFLQLFLRDLGFHISELEVNLSEVMKPFGR